MRLLCVGDLQFLAFSVLFLIRNQCQRNFIRQIKTKNSINVTQKCSLRISTGEIGQLSVNKFIKFLALSVLFLMRNQCQRNFIKQIKTKNSSNVTQKCSLHISTGEIGRLSVNKFE